MANTIKDTEDVRQIEALVTIAAVRLSVSSWTKVANAAYDFQVLIRANAMSLRAVKICHCVMPALSAKAPTESRSAGIAKRKNM